MGQTTRTLARVLTVLLVGAGILTLTNGSPASAGETGRFCETWYYHANPASGWGFTSCVKLVHDTNQHAWGAVGSVSTTTSGMVLHTADVEVDLYNIDNTFILRRIGSAGPAATLIDNIKSPFVTCSGILKFRGDIKEFVTWPDGETSSTTDTFIVGDLGFTGPDARITGSC
jgi:hypothetical protein